MKRLFLLPVIAMVIGLASCSKKEKCWEISMMGMMTTYWWGTKADVEAANKAPGVSIKAVSKTESECEGGEFVIPVL